MFFKLNNTDRIPYPIGRNVKEALPIVKDMADNLKSIYKITDNIQFVCRGSSGALISGMLASYMSNYNIRIIYIHKPNEYAHSYMEVKGTDNIVIVDDFIDSAETVNIIYKALQKDLFDDNVIIDTLCVSNRVHQLDLAFIPNNIISGMYFNNQSNSNSNENL